MKPPDEVKKDLGRCLDRWAPVHFESCESDCPYHSEGTLCKSTLYSDVISYIQRLEETIENLGHLNKTMYDEAKNGIKELESRLAQVERERDAAVHDLKLADRVDCDFCKHQYGGCTYDGCKDCSKPCPCGSCRNSSNYEWRGVCEANTEEGTK